MHIQKRERGEGGKGQQTRDPKGRHYRGKNAPCITHPLTHSTLSIRQVGNAMPRVHGLDPDAWTRLPPPIASSIVLHSSRPVDVRTFAPHLIHSTSHRLSLLACMAAAWRATATPAYHAKHAYEEGVGQI